MLRGRGERDPGFEVGDDVREAEEDGREIGPEAGGVDGAFDVGRGTAGAGAELDDGVRGCGGVGYVSEDLGEEGGGMVGWGVGLKEGKASGPLRCEGYLEVVLDECWDAGRLVRMWWWGRGHTGRGRRIRRAGGGRGS